tara:strand:+ start:761 stop:1453 length:693 start_codon:yes stop_codon:yes gene_type:complete
LNKTYSGDTMKIKLLVLSLILTGCMSMSIPQFQNVTTYRQGKIPELNQESSTDVGSTIYTEFDYQEIETIRLTESVKSSMADIPANTSLTAMTMDGVLVYQPYGTVNFPGILLSDQNEDGKLDRIKDISSMNSSWRNLQPEVAYEEAESIPTQSGGFKLELVYQGLTDNQIKVLYREYNNNIARPAFTQNVEYELDNDGESLIAFKGARIEVLEASSTEIKYRVIKGFEN